MTAIASNSIQVIIRAKDEATKTFEGIKTVLDQTSVGAALAQAKFAAMAVTISQLASTGITKLSQLANIVSTIKETLFDTAAGQSIVKQFTEAAEAAISNVAPLSVVLGTITSDTKLLGSEFANLGKASLLEDIADRFQKSFEGSFDAILNQAAKVAPKVVKIFRDNEAFASNVLFRTLIRQRVPQPLRQVLDFTIKGDIGAQVENLEKLFSLRLPSELKEVLSATADQDFSGRLVDLLGSEQQLLKLVQSPAIRNIIKGSLRRAVEETLGVEADKAFRTAFTKINNIVENLAFQAGSKAGSKFVNGLESPFQAINRETEGRLETFINGLANSASKFLPQGLIGNVLKGLADESFGDFSRIFFKLFGEFSAEAEQAIAQNLLAKIFRGLSVTGLTAFEKQFSTIQKVVNDGSNAIVSTVETLFPRVGQKIRATVASIGEGVEELTVGKIAKALTDIPLDRLTKQAEEIGKAFKVLELQSQRADISLSPDIDIDTKNLKLEEINKQIQSALGEVDPKLVNLDAESLTQELQKVQKELDKINQQKTELQQEAINIAVNPDLSALEKEELIGKINQRIEEVGKKIPIEALLDNIREDLQDLLGVELINNIEENIRKGFQKINQFFGGIPTEALNEIGQNAGRQFRRGFQSQLANAFAPIIDQIDRFVVGSLNKIKAIPETFATPLAQTGNILGLLGGIRDPLEIFSIFRDSLQSSFTVLARLGEQLTFFQSGLQVLQGFVQNGPFRLLIQQNIRLQEQLLGTQTSLVSTNQIVNAFTQQAITDNTEAIKALTQPIDAAIADLRQKSLKLVGVTSSQLIEAFQIIAGQAGGIGASLDEVTDLTIAFSASLGTLGIPLFQARQEITSIVQGTIDMNSVLAKSIGLTNDQVRQWKSQGVLVDKLLEKLEAFKEGNAIAANTVGGITSNIQEVVENIGLLAGKPLLDPIVEELKGVYEFLEANTDAIAQQVSAITQNIFAGLQALLNAVKTVLGTAEELLSALPGYFGASLGNFLTIFAESLENAIKVLEPFIKVLGGIAGALRPILANNPFLKLALQATILSKGIRLIGKIFGTFVNILPGVGEALFGINLRMLPLVNLLPNLRGELGKGAGSLLFFGKVLNQIPGAAKGVSDSLKFLGPLAPLVTGLIPGIAGVAIQIVGLSKVFPPLNNLIQGFLASNPTTLLKTLGLAIKSLPLVATVPLVGKLGDRILNLSGSLARSTQATTVATLATNFYEAQVKKAAIAARTFAIRTALLGVGLFAAFKIIDKFLLQNKELTEVLSGIVEGLLGTFADLLEVLSNKFVLITTAIVGSTTAILLFRKAILGVIVLEVTTWAAGAAAAFKGLSLALGKLTFLDAITSFQALGRVTRLLSFGSIADGAALASKSLKNLIVFLKGGTVANTTFAASLKGVAAGLFAVTAPLAIVVAGLAAIGAIRYGKALKEALEANDIYARQTNRVFTESSNALASLNQLREEQNEKTANGIALSEEEIAANKEAVAQAKGRLFLVEEQIKAEIEARKVEEDRWGTSQAAIAGYDRRIEDLTKRAEKLRQVIGAVILQNKELSEKGLLDEQLLKRAETLEEAVTNTNGQEEKFAANVTEFVQNTQTLLDRGLITTEEAERRLRLVASNTLVNIEGQTKARQALIQVYQEEEAAASRLADKTLNLIRLSQKERQVALTQEIGLTSDRLALQEQAFEFEQEGTEAELKNSQKRTKDLSDRLAKIRAAAKEEKKLIQDRIKELEKAQRKALDEVEFNALQAQIDRLISLLNKAAVETPKQIGEIEAKILQERIKGQDLLLKLAQDEERALDLSLSRRRTQLERFNQELSNQLEGQNQKLRQQVQLYQSIEKSLSLQSQLISAAGELQNNTVGLIEKQINFLAKTEKNQRKQQQLVESTAAIRVKALLQSQTIEQKNLEIQQQQNLVALEREKIENRIAQSQAQVDIGGTLAEIELARADSRTTPQQITALELKLTSLIENLNNLRTTGNLIGVQADNLRKIQELERESLSVSQRSSLLDAQIQFAESLVSFKEQQRAKANIEKTVLEGLGISKGRSATIKELFGFSGDVFAEIFPRRQLKPEGFIDFGGGNKVLIENLVSESRQIRRGQRQLGQDIKQSFIDFGGGKVEVLPSARPEVSRFELPQLQLPEVSLSSLTTSVQSGLTGLQQGLGGVISSEAQRVVDAIKNAQASNYNITVNANKEVRKAQSNNNNNEQKVDITKLVRELTVLAGGI